MTVRHPRIAIDPDIMSGQPVIVGTRVPVSIILNWFGRGASIEEVLSEYPTIAREDVLAALAFSADAMSRKRLELAEP